MLEKYYPNWMGIRPNPEDSPEEGDTFSEGDRLQDTESANRNETDSALNTPKTSDRVQSSVPGVLFVPWWLLRTIAQSLWKSVNLLVFLTVVIISAIAGRGRDRDR
jgi:hypothetical protein